MNLSLVLLYIHLGLIPDLCFIANILFKTECQNVTTGTLFFKDFSAFFTYFWGKRGKE